MGTTSVKQRFMANWTRVRGSLWVSRRGGFVATVHLEPDGWRWTIEGKTKGGHRRHGGAAHRRSRQARHECQKVLLRLMAGR